MKLFQKVWDYINPKIAILKDFASLWGPVNKKLGKENLMKQAINEQEIKTDFI